MFNITKIKAKATIRATMKSERIFLLRVAMESEIAIMDILILIEDVTERLKLNTF